MSSESVSLFLEFSIKDVALKTHCCFFSFNRIELAFQKNKREGNLYKQYTVQLCLQLDGEIRALTR